MKGLLTRPGVPDSHQLIAALPPGNLDSVAIHARIYQERYLLVTLNDHPLSPQDTITWAQAAQGPLCLLTPDMQNRRIVDAAFQTAGAQPTPRVEANSVSALLSHALSGWSCVIAHTWLTLHKLPENVRALSLTEPDITHTIGLVSPDTDIHHPLARALHDQPVTVDPKH